MPLVWAHGEFLKLLVARERGRPVELLKSVERHFGEAGAKHRGRRGPGRLATICHWRDEVPVTRIPRGKSLAIQDREPFTLHLGVDGWQRLEDRRAEPTPLGLWSVLLTERELDGITALSFTRRYESGWENRDHRVEIGPDGDAHALIRAVSRVGTSDAPVLRGERNPYGSWIAAEQAALDPESKLAEA